MRTLVPVFICCVLAGSLDAAGAVPPTLLDCFRPFDAAALARWIPADSGRELERQLGIMNEYGGLPYYDAYIGGCRRIRLAGPLMNSRLPPDAGDGVFGNAPPDLIELAPGARFLFFTHKVSGLHRATTIWKTGPDGARPCFGLRGSLHALRRQADGTVLLSFAEPTCLSEVLYEPASGRFQPHFQALFHDRFRESWLDGFGVSLAGAPRAVRFHAAVVTPFFADADLASPVIGCSPVGVAWEIGAKGAFRLLLVPAVASNDPWYAPFGGRTWLPVWALARGLANP